MPGPYLFLKDPNPRLTQGIDPKMSSVIQFTKQMSKLFIYANPSNVKVSECLFFTERIKQGSQFDDI